MEDRREEDSGAEGKGIRRGVSFRGNGGGLPMWVCALSFFMAIRV